MNLFNDGNGGVGLGASVAKHQLIVEGDSSDIVDIINSEWTTSGTVTYGGVTYSVHNHNTVHAQLLTEWLLTVN